MSGAANRAAGFVTAQVIEYVPPTIAVPSYDVDTVIEEAGTMRGIIAYLNTYDIPLY